MCDVPNCNEKATVDVGPSAHSTALCETHRNQDEFPRTWCGGCRRLASAGPKIVVTYTPYTSSTVVVCKYCTVAAKCRACGVPAAVTVDNEAEPMVGAIEVTSGGKTVGWRCADCSTNRVSTTQEAKPHFESAEKWLAKWVLSCNWKYPNYGKRLSWDLARDETFYPDGDGRTLGSCKTKSQNDSSPTHHITVLNRVPRVVFEQTLVHELTHALANEYGFGNSRYIEGLCNYAEYRFLLDVQKNGNSADQAVATIRLKQLENDTSWEYGEHFKYVRRVADKLNAKETALDLIKRKYQELDSKV